MRFVVLYVSSQYLNPCYVWTSSSKVLASTNMQLASTSKELASARKVPAHINKMCYIFDHGARFLDLYENMMRLTKANSETIGHYLVLFGII